MPEATANPTPGSPEAIARRLHAAFRRHDCATFRTLPWEAMAPAERAAMLDAAGVVTDLVAEEREACARLAEEYADHNRDVNKDMTGELTASCLAAALRARG